MEILSNLAMGFGVALTPFTLFLAVVGCFLGTIIGALPGLGPSNGVAILIPLAFSLGLDATQALVLLRNGELVDAVYHADCGGITEAMRIGAIASAWNIKLAPHLWTGALAFAAGMHVAAASPAGWLLEYSVGANPLLQELAEEQFSVHQGMVEIADRPGLGVTIRQDFVDRHTVA